MRSCNANPCISTGFFILLKGVLAKARAKGQNKTMFKININAGKSAGKSYYVRTTERKVNYHDRFSSTPRKAKRNRRKAISFNTRVRSFNHLVKILGWCWKYGIKISFMGFLIYIAIWSSHRPEQKPIPLTEAQGEWQDNYPKVIGLLKPQEDLFVKYFGDVAPVMKAIAQAESGMNPEAVSKTNRNGTQDFGILQVNSTHADKVGGDTSKLLDLETNLRVSKEILDSQGLKAWTCYKNGAYKQYLK